MADAPACRDAGVPRVVPPRAVPARRVHRHAPRDADVNGNHYLCDGVGLVFLGCFFHPARRAARWRAIGRAIVEQEIFNQTTADGVDFEQSTAYHRLVLEAFLTSYELLRRHGETVPAACWARLERMCEFVQAYTKPDGRAPLIGDADDGRVQMLGAQPINDHRYLLSSAARSCLAAPTSRARRAVLGRDVLAARARTRRRDVRRDAAARAAGQSKAFHDGGYYVLRSDRAHVVVDCGEVGMNGPRRPRPQRHPQLRAVPERLQRRHRLRRLSLHGVARVAEPLPEHRVSQHVQVDGEELNRFVGPDALWQLHYDARPVGAAMTRADRVNFRGGASGLPAAGVAGLRTREVSSSTKRRRACSCAIELDGAGRRTRCVWRFHLDPAVAAGDRRRDVRLSRAGDGLAAAGSAAATFALSLEPGWVSPSYGVKVPTTVLVWRATARGAADTVTICSLPFAESRLA